MARGLSVADEVTATIPAIKAKRAMVRDGAAGDTRCIAPRWLEDVADEAPTAALLYSTAMESQLHM